MEQTRYYPVIDCDTEGRIKAALFPCCSEDTVRKNHRVWLEESITYDTLIEQYFSVKKEYRKNAVWLMNDVTALALRKLKDADGNYLWNSNNDTILDKLVYISEFMPDARSGSKPVAFGDFSYYWFISRSPVSLRTLTEQFAINDQVGYLGLEFVEGKLIRRDAVKVISMK